VAVTLRDTTSDGEQIVLASWEPPGAVVDVSSTRRMAIDAQQRVWQLQVAATNRLLPDSGLHLVAAAWTTGAVITMLLALLTATLASSRDRAVRRVEQATAALRDDIARREQVEERLRRREDELVGFAGVVAHDLRGPLARISAYTDFLREEAAPGMSGEHRGFLERLRSGATRMQSLLDDLLDYATADNRPLKISPVDLSILIADVIAERNGTATEHPPILDVGHLPTVDGDPVLLRQVLENLIGNAVKYTRYGDAPHIEITAEPEPDSTMWRIEIHDHGIGIPAEQRDSIFTAFTRATGSEGYPGTGLGLAIVHRIIERHSGHIGVTGNEHGGSVFWVLLPGTSVGGEPSPAPESLISESGP